MASGGQNINEGTRKGLEDLEHYPPTNAAIPAGKGGKFKKERDSLHDVTSDGRRPYTKCDWSEDDPAEHRANVMTRFKGFKQAKDVTSLTRGFKHRPVEQEIEEFYVPKTGKPREAV